MLTNTLKAISIQMLLIFAISCGVNTAYYIRQKYINILNKWQLYLLLAGVFIAGVSLNYILYFKNIAEFFSDKKTSSSIPANLIGSVITFFASVATAIFSYYSSFALHLHPFVSWSLAIAAGVVTFALLIYDTIKLVDSIKETSLKGLSLKKSMLTLVFIIGTIGLIYTSYSAFIAMKIPSLLAVFLIAGLIVAEGAFIYSNASEVIKGYNELSWNKTGLFIALCMVPALLNGFANGILDAANFSGTFGTLTVVCGVILSVCIMMNSICIQAKDEKRYSISKLFEHMKQIITNKAQILSFLSFISIDSALLMFFQFNVPYMAIWLPSLILGNVCATTSYVYCSDPSENAPKSSPKV